MEAWLVEEGCGDRRGPSIKANRTGYRCMQLVCLAADCEHTCVERIRCACATSPAKSLPRMHASSTCSPGAIDLQHNRTRIAPVRDSARLLSTFRMASTQRSTDRRHYIIYIYIYIHYPTVWM